jgi:hypothetical protein
LEAPHLPLGFKYATAYGGIREQEKDDLALIVSAHHFAVDVGEAEIATRVPIRQLRVVDAHLIQHFACRS